MHTEVVAKYLSTLPEDDTHPYRTGAGAHRPPSGTPTT